MKLAITGGIAEGKSTVASYVREAGYEVASADEIARQVFESSEVQSELSILFGHSLPITPEVVGKVVFQNPTQLRALNACVHPRIWVRLKQIEAPVVEVPLLFETTIQGHFDRIWVVTCGPEEQLRRLAARLGDEQSARNQLNAQLKTCIKCAFADRIVRTNGEPFAVRSYVSEAIRRDL